VKRGQIRALMNDGFLEKLIGRIERIGPEEVQAYIVRLARRKGLLETIFNAIREGLIVTDAAGQITYVNDAACEIFGLTREDCIGRELGERIRGFDWNPESFKGKAISRDIEVFYPKKRFLNFYVAPLSVAPTDEGTHPAEPHPEPELIGHAVILRDLTEDRKMTEAAIESERFSALMLLAGGVAHEIGNPLNSLHIHLQLAERRIRRLPESERRALSEPIRVARDEIRRLDHIVSQFLRAVRPTPIDPKRENLNEILRESVAFLEPEARDREILIENKFARNLPPINADRDQLKQAFYNIMRNGFQAMQGGGLLRITTGSGDDHVTVTFADTGGGIPDEAVPKIFDPYFTTRESGSGLGLMIVRRIVREHAGEIDLVNDSGRGVSFTIRLPRADIGVRMLPPAENAAGEER
jgi:signal transduction histidine kinase